MNSKTLSAPVWMVAFAMAAAVAAGGAAVAHADEPAPATITDSTNIVATISDIVKWKYADAVAEAAEDAAEAEAAALKGAPDAAEEAADAEESAYEAEQARQLAEKHADNMTPVTLPSGNWEDDLDDAVISDDGTAVYWDDGDLADGGDDDDGDRYEIDDDADDDGDGRKKKASLAKQRVGNANENARASARAVRLPWPMCPLAWADEPNADAEHVDARTILGVEGPYLILREAAESPDGPMTIVAVTSLASAVESAQRSAWLLAAIMLAVLGATIAFAWVLTGRTLKPVEAMRAQAASITAENLGQRIDVPASDKDLARLAETLNDMLERVERSLDEEKRFISDASHELKSPVAATAVILDTLRAYPDDLDVSQALDDLAGENARMASIVGDMLALTRYDEGRLQCDLDPVDLMDLVLEEAAALQARASCNVDTTDIKPVVCHADPGLLAHALRNVLDNAARYARTVVKVSCAQEGDEIVITVSDDGPGITPEDRERAFGRFVCLDERSGTGLGLAVVASAIEAHAGRVSFVDPELSGATIRIELPA